MITIETSQDLKVSRVALAKKAGVHRHTAAKYLRGDISKMQYEIINRLKSAYEALTNKPAASNTSQSENHSS